MKNVSDNNTFKTSSNMSYKRDGDFSNRRSHRVLLRNFLLRAFILSFKIKVEEDSGLLFNFLNLKFGL